MGFCSFYFESIFLRNQSLSNARWLYDKKKQNCEGESVFTENRSSRNECGVLQITTIICVIYVQKNFKIRNLIKQLLTKYQIFTKLSQISHIHKNRNCSNWNFSDQLLLPYKFYGRDMSGIYFFIFASCEPLKAQCQFNIQQKLTM